MIACGSSLQEDFQVYFNCIFLPQLLLKSFEGFKHVFWVLMHLNYDRDIAIHLFSPSSSPPGSLGHTYISTHHFSFYRMTKHLSDSLLLLLGPTTQLSTIVDTPLYSPNSQAIDKLRQRPLVCKESILYFLNIFANTISSQKI